jgi:hypothetical protein
MKFLKNFKKYQESIKIEFGIINIDINESLGLLYDTILRSIGAEQSDIFDTFHLSKDDFILEIGANDGVCIKHLLDNDLLEHQ